MILGCLGFFLGHLIVLFFFVYIFFGANVLDVLIHDRIKQTPKMRRCNSAGQNLNS